MSKVFIRRYYQDEDVTLGVLNVGHHKHLPIYTLEKPWKDNQRNISCIPHGVYKIRDYTSLKYKSVFEICNVPNRSKILFHVGNYENETQGCILPGLGTQYYGNQLMVTRSGDAMRALKELIKEDMELDISNQYGEI